MASSMMGLLPISTSLAPAAWHIAPVMHLRVVPPTFLVSIPSLPPAVGALYQFLCIPEDAGSELHDSISLLSFNLSLPLSDLQKPMVARLTMALRFHCVCRFIRLASRSIRRGNSFSIQSRIIRILVTPNRLAASSNLSINFSSKSILVVLYFFCSSTCYHLLFR